jgi:hypothetical protein
MKQPKSTEQRKREHVERMLARAERRHKQTGRLVEKWRVKLEELGPRENIASPTAPMGGIGRGQRSNDLGVIHRQAAKSLYGLRRASFWATVLIELRAVGY